MRSAPRTTRDAHVVWKCAARQSIYGSMAANFRVVDTFCRCAPQNRTALSSGQKERRCLAGRGEWRGSLAGESLRIRCTHNNSSALCFVGYCSSFARCATGARRNRPIRLHRSIAPLRSAQRGSKPFSDGTPFRRRPSQQQKGGVRTPPPASLGCPKEKTGYTGPDRSSRSGPDAFRRGDGPATGECASRPACRRWSGHRACRGPP